MQDMQDHTRRPALRSFPWLVPDPRSVSVRGRCARRARRARCSSPAGAVVLVETQAQASQASQAFPAWRQLPGASHVPAIFVC
jgi:hypothetical protein